MLLPSKSQFRFILALLLLVSLCCRATNAQSAADTCRADSCLDFRALAVGCGYDIDRDQAREKTYDETMCICGDSSYTRISKKCFGCIDALDVAGYNASQWGEDCYEAYLQKPVQRSAAAGGGGGGGGGGGEGVGLGLGVYVMLLVATANVGLLL